MEVRRRRRGSLWAVVLAAGAGLALPVPAALAGAAVVSGGTVLYTAAPGETNDVTIGVEGAEIVIDEAAPLETGSGTCPLSAGALRCPSAGVTRIDLLLGDGDDAADGATTGIALVLRGQGGADVLRGGGGSDLLEGGEGDDLLDGRAGDDLALGGDGDDTIAGAQGADGVSGGAGRDHLDHASSPAPVSVDLQAGALSGGDAEGDVVSPDVERITGSVFPDALAGTDAGDERLEGGPGADVLEGRGGDDTLVGGGSQDLILGGEGGDVLDGGPGGDDLLGGPGDDVSTYASSPAAVAVDAGGESAGGYAAGDDLDAVEVITGSPFDDVLAGSDAPERLEGGPGDDLLRGADGDDTLAGQGGDDRLEGGAGADLLTGDAGVDTADYSTRSGPVTADPGAAADDGEAGEGDRIATDVEEIDGGAGADTLSARDAGTAAVLRGGPGDDLLDVGDGAGGDRVEGGDGTDLATRDAGDVAGAVEGAPAAGPMPPRAAGASPGPPAAPDLTPPLMRLTRGVAARSRGGGRSVTLTLTDDHPGALGAEVVLLGRVRGRCARLGPGGAVVERPRRARSCAPRRAVVLAATAPFVLRVPPAGYGLRVTPRDAAGNRGAPAVVSGPRLSGG